MSEQWLGVGRDRAGNSATLQIFFSSLCLEKHCGLGERNLKLDLENLRTHSLFQYVGGHFCDGFLFPCLALSTLGKGLSLWGFCSTLYKEHRIPLVVLDCYCN